MSLGDIYNFIERIQNTIGGGCRVYLSIESFNVLVIKVQWINNEKVFTYQRAYSDLELRYIQDENFLVDWFCFQAIRAHKLETIKEE